jgi:hypothetical protein
MCVCLGLFSPPLDAAIPLPSAVLGAGSSPSDFAYRFKNNQDLCEPIASDNARDDETLQELCESMHLDDMWGTIKDLAMQAAEDEAEEKAEKEKRYAEFVDGWDEEGLAVDEASSVVEDGIEEDFIKEEEETDEDNVVRGVEDSDYGHEED